MKDSRTVTFTIAATRLRSAFLLSVVAVVGLAVVGVPVPAPATPMFTQAPGADPEGGSPALRAALEDASRGYSDASARLAASRQRQSELGLQQRVMTARVDRLRADVGQLASSAYRDGELSMLDAAVDSGSVNTFLDKSVFLDQLSFRNGQKFAALKAAKNELDRATQRIAGEVALQAAQERAMAKRKADAQRALGVTSGDAGSDTGAERSSRSAPRNPDGSLPREGCTLDDPTTTTSGCISPRLRLAYDQARAAGFTRFTRCFRVQASGEHGKGRACDFAAAPNTFGGVATGGDRSYGDRLAAYFIANADRLGVLYVIWFRRIWLPGVGWGPYDGSGSPSAEHTNHVHLSVQ
jgi:hypothetical protein